MEQVENNKEQFESEFCHVTYDLERRMVLFTWIMEEVSDIEEEMDMWGKEISKYFELTKVTSYEEVIKRIGINE